MIHLEDLQSHEKVFKIDLWIVMVVMGVLYSLCLLELQKIV